MEGLAHSNAALLELNMDDGHAVDEENEVAPSVAQDFGGALELRLPDDLVAALPRGYLPPIVDLEAHLLAEVEAVLRVVPGDGDGLAVDEAVQLEGRAERGDLLHDLLHLAICEGVVAQPVYAAVVVEEYGRPVLQKVLFTGVFDDLLFPALAGEGLDEGVLEVGFLGEGHRLRILILNHFPFGNRSRLGLFVYSLNAPCIVVYSKMELTTASSSSALSKIFRRCLVIAGRCTPKRSAIAACVMKSAPVLYSNAFPSFPMSSVLNSV